MAYEPIKPQLTYGLAGAIETTILVAQVVVHTWSRVNLVTMTCVNNTGCTSTSAVFECILAVIRGLIHLRCYRTLGWFFTFELSILLHHKLIMSGPYAIVQHPSCMAVILVLGRAIFVHST